MEGGGGGWYPVEGGGFGILWREGVHLSHDKLIYKACNLEKGVRGVPSSPSTIYFSSSLPFFLSFD